MSNIENSEIENLKDFGIYAGYKLNCDNIKQLSYSEFRALGEMEKLSHFGAGGVMAGRAQTLYKNATGKFFVLEVSNGGGHAFMFDSAETIEK